MDKTINLKNKNEFEEETRNVEKSGWGMRLFFIVLTLALGMFLGAKFWSKAPVESKSAKNFVNPAQYQAIFLTNGQTYFGKVFGENEQYVTLNDGYYMVTKQLVQEQKDEASATNRNEKKPAAETTGVENAGNEDINKTGQNYSLVKIGSEVHGPTSMNINRDQIIYIENLSDDSKVVSAIKGQK